MNKYTKTINKLHFEDLSPIRFEDLTLNLVYPLNKWRVINHYGASGNDDGIDIYAEDELENGSRRIWFIQCKRYKKLSYGGLKEALDSALEKNNPIIPDIFLVVAPCKVSKTSLDKFNTYAQKKGVKNPLVWSKSILESKLYYNRKDLLFTYFGIDLLNEMKKREKTIQRNILLKKRMDSDFRKKNLDMSIDYYIEPYKKYKYRDLIIHSIDDSFYPESNDKQGEISGWFKVEFFDFYFNGIEVMLSLQSAIKNKQGNWTVIPHGYEFDQSKFEKFGVVLIGQIPFKNIIDYDLIGDEYYRCPHIYCNFAEQGEPYENFTYVLQNKKDFIFLPEKRLPLKDLENH